MKNGFYGLCVFALLVHVLCAARAEAAYSDNPLAQWWARQTFEARIDAQVDFAGNDHDSFGFLVGAGRILSDSLTVGLYASQRGSDREWPDRMTSIYGFGAYADYLFSPGDTIRPFVGARVGVLDPTGPRYPTPLHLSGVAGARIALTQRLDLAVSGVASWADDDIFNYRESSRSADPSDLTMDIGVRVIF